MPRLISVARGNSGSIKIIVTCRKKEEAAPAGGRAYRKRREKDNGKENGFAQRSH